jgi:hypothetical protein
MLLRVGPRLILSALLIALFAIDMHIGAAADQAAPFKRIVSKYTFRPSPGAPPFCRAFLRDFRTQKSVRFIEPVVEAQTYDDPVLEPYKRMCGEQPLNELFTCEARGAPEWDTNKAWKERRNELLAQCDSSHMTSNFKVFELDINDDPVDGVELVIHGEKSLGPMNRQRAKFYGNGAYNIFNGKTCDLNDSIPTSDPFAYFLKQRLDSHNAIVTYGGRYFIIDLYELSGSGRNPLDPIYGLEVWGSGPRNQKLQCAYSSSRKAVRKNSQGAAK